MDLTRLPPHMDSDDARMALRIVLASAIAWGLAAWLGGPLPVFAAIVPMVGLRSEDPYGVIDISVWRIVGTMVGVLLGLVVLRVTDPPSPWAIVATITAGVLLGFVFRRRGAAYNPLVAVTAALILAWGGSKAGELAPARLWETALGGVVAIAAGLFLWPTDPIEGLTALMTDEGEAAIRTLERIRALPGATSEAADDILHKMVQEGEGAPDVMSVLARTDQGLRYNPLRRNERSRLPEMAVRARTLSAIQRYGRSAVWDLASDASMMGTVPDTGPAMHDLDALLDALTDAARAIARGAPADHAVARGNAAMDAFAAGAQGAGARELQNDLRVILRVLGPYTQRAIRTHSAERYGR